MIQALIDKIAIVQTDEALTGLLQNIRQAALVRPVRVAFVNAHAVNLCHNDPDFLQNMLACDYLLRDGSGMKMLYRWLGREPGLNLNGTDLIPRILELCRGQEILLIGTTHPWLDQAASAIEAKGGIVAGMMDGFQDTEAYIQLAERTAPKLVILAMGMPRQEAVAAALAARLDQPCLIVCGGAILDFLGGKVPRAPYFFRKLGVEWVYRLAREPKRLFKRYVAGNGVFLYRAFRLARQSKCSNSGI